MPETLEQVLADLRGDAAVLRRRHDERAASLLEDAAQRVAAASEDYLRFLPETDASLWSGHSAAWLRGKFPEWEAAGHAKKEHGQRFYRAVVLPRRTPTSLAREAGRRGERPASAA